MTTITLDTLRAAADRLGAAADVSKHLAAELQTRLQAAVAPIYAAARDAIDAAAEEQAVAEICIRTVDSLVIDALAQLDARTLTSLGVRRIPGVDNPVLTIGATDADALVKAIIQSAMQRAGEDEKPKATKKGKAKAKAAEKEGA